MTLAVLCADPLAGAPVADASGRRGPTDVHYDGIDLSALLRGEATEAHAKLATLRATAGAADGRLRAGDTVRVVNGRCRLEWDEIKQIVAAPASASIG